MLFLGHSVERYVTVHVNAVNVKVSAHQTDGQEIAWSDTTRYLGVYCNVGQGLYMLSKKCQACVLDLEKSPTLHRSIGVRRC